MPKYVLNLTKELLGKHSKIRVGIRVMNLKVMHTTGVVWQ
jgi:hypothetical protein